MVARDIDHDLQRRQALAAGIAGLREELFCPRQILLQAVRRNIAVDPGRGEGVGRLLAASDDFLHDGAPVECQRKRLAHAFVAEVRSRGVEAVKVSVEKGTDPQCLWVIAPIAVHFADGQRLGDVQLPGAECAFLPVHIGGRVEVDGIQAHGGGVPVGQGFVGDNYLAALVGLENEGAVADESGRISPAGVARRDAAVFLERGQVDGIPDGMGKQGQQVRGGVGQCEPERVVVGGGDADLREVGQPALIPRLGVRQHEEHGGVVGAEVFGEDALDGAGEVLGGDRFAVGPFRVGAEVEGPGEAIGRHHPALGNAGNGVSVDWVLGDKALEERGSDVDLGQAGDEVWIETREIGGEAAMQHLLADAAGDVGFTLCATGKEWPQKAQKAQKSIAGHSERSEESKAMSEGGHADGSFAALRMTESGFTVDRVAA